jgi:Transposase DDE domain
VTGTIDPDATARTSGALVRRREIRSTDARTGWPGSACSTRAGRRWRGRGSSATWQPPSGRSRSTTPARAASPRGEAVLPARLIVRRLSPTAATRAAKAQHRRQNRCRSHRPLQPLTVQATGYLTLVTSLPIEVPAGKVLEAYRRRWQVELAFKRLKSLLGLSRLPVKTETLARSWLLAHLIMALLIEDISRPLLEFSPSADGDRSTRHLALARHPGAA